MSPPEESSAQQPAVAPDPPPTPQRRPAEGPARRSHRAEPRDRGEARMGAFEIGELVVAAAFALMVAAWALGARFPRADIAQNILMAGFVGGFTNTVAIRMLFTRHWFLPGSGVLLKERDAIIVSLADTMEQHILNPRLIESRVVELAGQVDRERVADVLNGLLDETRSDLIDFARAPEQRRQIVAALKVEGGFWGSMADALGIVTYDVVADRLTAGLAEQIRRFRITGALVEAALARVGSLDSLILQPGHPFVAKHYGTERSLAQAVFEALDAKQLVIDRLSTYDAEAIRDIVSDNIRKHLAWLQVFGVLLGMAFAAVIEIIDALL